VITKRDGQERAETRNLQRKEGGRDGSSQRERERERERQTMHFNAPAHMRAYHLRKETIRNAFARVLEKEAMQIYTQNT